MSLRAKIVALVVLLVFAGIWGLALSVVSVQRTDLEKLILDQLSAMVENTAGDLDGDIRLHIDSLAKLAASITPEILADPEKFQGALERGTAASVLFPLGIFATDAQGTIVADSPQLPGRRGASVKDRDYFREAVARGKPVIGAPIMGRLVRPKPVVSIAVPLRASSGETKAVLVSPVPLSDPMMVTQLEQTKIGQTGYYLVLAPKERRIVSASDRSRIFEKLPAAGTHPLLDRQLQSDSGAAGVVKNLQGVEILSVSRKMQTTGWVVVGAVPTDEIFMPIARLKKYIYLAALFLSLGIAAILHFILARQFAPLDKAREAMRDMTAGQQPLEAIPVARADEIGKLIGSFNELALERNRLELVLKGEVVAHKQAGEALHHALGRLQSLCERMTQAQEEERRKVALELHEQAAQDLITLKMHLQQMDAHHTDHKAKAQLRDAITIAGLALTRIRTLSLNLHSPLLDNFGLRVALHRHCQEQADRTGWTMHFDAPEMPERPHPDVETACFRMVQEALKNAAQHADATEVWVNLLRSDAAIHVRVRDNGVGFDALEPGADTKHASFGLHAMAERVRQVGGRVDVRSAPGRGTEVHARFPVSEVAEDTAASPGIPARIPLVQVGRTQPL